MSIGKCLKCDSIGEMTTDHVVPQWFNKALENFGLKKMQNGITELVCTKCNSKKGGKIDYEDTRVREVMKTFATYFVQEIRKYEQFNP